MQRSAKQRFDELVVWYANGTLEPDERRWVEDYLREHPAARHELDWHDQLKRASNIQEIPIPQAPGLKALLQHVRAERSQQQEAGLLDRIARFFSVLGQRPGYALAGLVMLAQATALGVLVLQINDRNRIISEYSETRAVSPQPPLNDAPTLQVTFKSSATEQQIRLLLVSIQASIVSGPRQLGDYTLALPRKGFNEAKATLQNSPIIEGVSQQAVPSNE